MDMKKNYILLLLLCLCFAGCKEYGGGGGLCLLLFR